MASSRRRLAGPVIVSIAVGLSWQLVAVTGGAQPQLPAPSMPDPSSDEPAGEVPSPLAPPHGQPMPPRTPPAPVTYAPAPEPEAATILGSHVTHGGYGGPDGKLTSFGGSAALLMGGQGGWIISHGLIVGASAYTLVNDIHSPAELQTPGTARSTLSFSYGGGRIAFVPYSKRAVHLVLGMLVGGGRVSSSSANGGRVGQGTVVIEPDLAVELNLARPVRIAAGGTYRFTGGTQLAGLDASAMDGPAAFLALKFGEF